MKHISQVLSRHSMELLCSSYFVELLYSTHIVTIRCSVNIWLWFSGVWEVILLLFHSVDMWLQFSHQENKSRSAGALGTRVWGSQVSWSFTQFRDNPLRSHGCTMAATLQRAEGWPWTSWSWDFFSLKILDVCMCMWLCGSRRSVSSVLSQSPPFLFNIKLLLILWEFHTCIRCTVITFTQPSLPDSSQIHSSPVPNFLSSFSFHFFITHWIRFVLHGYSRVWDQPLEPGFVFFKTWSHLS